jgi:hypothetical protein
MSEHKILELKKTSETQNSGKKKNCVDAMLCLHDVTTAVRNCPTPSVSTALTDYLKNQPVEQKKIRTISLAAEVSTGHLQY